MVVNFVRVSAAILGLLAVAACDNSNTLVLEPNPATRVILDAARCPSVETCGSCQLEYQAYDKNSRPAPFPSLLWSAVPDSLATVEQTGLVRGWRPGLVTIKVEVLETGASDQVQFLVVSNPRIPCTPPAALTPLATVAVGHP